MFRVWQLPRFRERENGGLKSDWDNLRLQRMSDKGPPIMCESQHRSDNKDCPPKDPLLMALADMNYKLEGIERLEKKLEEATSNFTGVLDVIKKELANLKKARNNDSDEIN